MENIEGLVQGSSNSSALAMELLQSSTKPSIFKFTLQWRHISIMYTSVPQHFVKQHVQANIKLPHYWPFVRRMRRWEWVDPVNMAVNVSRAQLIMIVDTLTLEVQ